MSDFYSNNDAGGVDPKLAELMKVAAKFEVKQFGADRVKVVVHIDPEKVTKLWPLPTTKDDGINGLMTYLNERLIALTADPLEEQYVVDTGNERIEDATDTFLADEEMNSPWRIELTIHDDDAFKAHALTDMYNEQLAMGTGGHFMQ